MYRFSTERQNKYLYYVLRAKHCVGYIIVIECNWHIILFLVQYNIPTFYVHILINVCKQRTAEKYAAGNIKIY
jgi:hypothetical protein